MANSVRFNATLNDQVSGKLTKIRDNFDRLGKSKGAMSILQGVGLGAGVSAWNMVGSAVSAATDFMGDAVTAASGLREAMALNQQVFKDNSDEVAEWGKTAADAFGMSQREALTFAATFGTAFNSVGMSLDEATTKSETLTRLAADLGSAFNASSEEAANALRSGLIGESEPMRRFGVFLSEAAVQAKAVEIGISRAGEKLSDTQKVAARYAIIMEQTADSQGMFGRDSESLADAQKALTATFEDLQAAVGTTFQPFLARTANTIRIDLIPAIQSLDGALAEDSVLWMNFVDILKLPTQTPLWKWLDGTSERLGRTSDKAMEGADAWDTYAEKGAAAREATQKTGGALTTVTPQVLDLRDAFKSAAKWTEEFTDAYLAALDAMLGEADSPEDLALEIWSLDTQLSQAQKHLRELRAIEDPTAAQRQDMAETRLEINRLRRGIITTRTELNLLDGVSLTDIKAMLANLKKYGIDPLSAEAAELLGLLTRIGATSPSGGSHTWHIGVTPEAAGGPVTGGKTLLVGEKGPELFVPSTSGTIVPNEQLVPFGGGAPALAGGGPVNVAVFLDSEQIAARVERRQYFAASVAPASSR